MATNQTANYQLNQWEPTDQVLRTDFNADNAKLDAALAEKAEVETVSALQTAVEAAGLTVPVIGIKPSAPDALDRVRALLEM